MWAVHYWQTRGQKNPTAPNSHRITHLPPQIENPAIKSLMLSQTLQFKEFNPRHKRVHHLDNHLNKNLNPSCYFAAALLPVPSAPPPVLLSGMSPDTEQFVLHGVGRQGTTSRALAAARSLSHEQRTGSLQGEVRHPERCSPCGAAPAALAGTSGLIPACRDRRPAAPAATRAGRAPAGRREAPARLPPPPRHGNQPGKRRAGQRDEAGWPRSGTAGAPRRTARPGAGTATPLLPPPGPRCWAAGGRGGGSGIAPRPAAGPAQTHGRMDGLTSLPRPSHAAAGTDPTLLLRRRAAPRHLPRRRPPSLLPPPLSASCARHRPAPRPSPFGATAPGRGFPAPGAAALTLTETPARKSPGSRAVLQPHPVGMCGGSRCSAPEAWFDAWTSPRSSASSAPRGVHTLLHICCLSPPPPPCSRCPPQEPRSSSPPSHAPRLPCAVILSSRRKISPLERSHPRPRCLWVSSKAKCIAKRSNASLSDVLVCSSAQSLQLPLPLVTRGLPWGRTACCPGRRAWFAWSLPWAPNSWHRLLWAGGKETGESYVGASHFFYM